MNCNGYIFCIGVAIGTVLGAAISTKVILDCTDKVVPGSKKMIKNSAKRTFKEVLHVR